MLVVCLFPAEKMCMITYLLLLVRTEFVANANSRVLKISGTEKKITEHHKNLQSKFK